MKRLHFERGHILSKLHDELIAAGFSPRHVEGSNADLWLTFEEDDVDEKAVRAVVERHDPTPVPPKPKTPVDALRAVVAPPIISGSRANPATLKTLLTRLDQLGLIRDQTTA